MSEREDNVYKAKLAEQAERYDGKYIFLIYLSSRLLYSYFSPTVERRFRKCPRNKHKNVPCASGHLIYSLYCNK